MNSLPKTKLGRWTLWLIIIFVLLLATGMFVVTFLGQTGGKTIFDNPLISVPMLGAGAAAITALLIGAVAIIKEKERSAFVFIATLIGLLVLIFILGEFLFPH